MFHTRKRQGQRTLHTVEQEEEEIVDYIIESLDGDSTGPPFGPNVLFTNLKINEHLINIKVECGSECSDAKEHCREDKEQRNFKHRKPLLRAYDGATNTIDGIINLDCTVTTRTMM